MDKKKFKYKLLLLLGLLARWVSLEAVNVDKLNDIFTSMHSPFNYDLQLKILPGEKLDAELFICLHGMGSDSTISTVMRANPAILPFHVIAFNFPDYGRRYKEGVKTTFGTFDEIAPALFILKKCIVDGRADKVHLYGFSAGGSAALNCVAVLNSSRYDTEMQKLGIGEKEKQRILHSIQQGSVVLEVPLKSFDEIADISGDRDVRLVARRAKKNGMTPIDNIKELRNLALNCFIYFAHPDRILGNKDDAEFIKRFKDANENGRTVALIGNNSGHTAYHPELWKAYKKFVLESN
ncbi:MAG: alpha/beta hydrolase [Candidatus Protochlamydia sp.]|nr:alpha/beta hydrolase [Candidatus Protochlamydia sp.]